MNNNKSPSYIADAAVLVIEPDLNAWKKLDPILRLYFGFVKHTKTAEQAKVSFRRFHFNLIIIDSTLLKEFWQALTDNKQQLDTLHTVHSNTRDDIAELCFPLNFILMSRSNEPELIIEAMRMGACDFLAKPLLNKDVDQAINQWQLRLSRKKFAVISDNSNTQHSLFIGESEIVQNIRQNLYEISLSHHHLLIEGEAGTGKKLVVKQLQLFSTSQSQIINIDCRDPSQIDWHQLTNRCTQIKLHSYLVITHINLLSIAEQTQLLHLLNSPIFQNNSLLRIISLSQLSLLNLVENKIFLSDLYYRIAVVNISLPSLCQHPEDIVTLVKFFTNNLLRTMENNYDEILSRFQAWQTADFLSLTEHNWPNNAQELKNTVEKCLIQNITPQHYFMQTQQKELERTHDEHDFPIEWSLKKIEKAHILRVMNIYQGNRILTAEHLGVARKTIDRKLKEWKQD
ncbi:sigma-54-dependent transcriptional regulator [Shewanella polaris]|uniref:Sigma-54-dependent Fis family transcriptional regulator n=1 Tax=Shewanella polaris TaxID=2588449 RepID=A0A4Y5YBU3_9GAMM|nr:sigma 54-interacting transcriptional regulator [Shewanella polaris]QDE30165.1 sigma-54-dependent Fis family transcriptional regulator [Shewanella polaris]